MLHIRLFIKHPSGSAVLLSASYYNYPGGEALLSAHTTYPCQHNTTIYITNYAAQVPETCYEVIPLQQYYILTHFLLVFLVLTLELLTHFLLFLLVLTPRYRQGLVGLERSVAGSGCTIRYLTCPLPKLGTCRYSSINKIIYFMNLHLLYNNFKMTF